MAYDWKTGITNGVAGAGTGSMAGPVGTVGGGILGALTGFFGGKDKMKKVPTLSKGQQALLDRINQMLDPNGQLGKGYGDALSLQQQYMDPSSEAVKQFTQPYMDQFNNRTIPGLAERFAGFGAMGGGLSSSGFGQSLSTAAGELQNQLAQIHGNLGMQASNNMMNQYNNQTQTALNAQPFGYAKPQQSGAQGAVNEWAQGGMPGLDKGISSVKDFYNKYFAPGI